MPEPSFFPHQPFPATQWSLIERARQPDPEGAKAALAALLQRYLPALRAHLMAGKRLAADRADDVLQGFVADKIIEQNLLDHARQTKGKFRSFLLVALNHYVISLHRGETAAKRSPQGGHWGLGDEALQVEEGHDPAEQFNVVWARQLIAEALRRMEEECAHSKQLDLWTIFQGRVIRPAFEGREAMEYGDLVRQLGLATPIEACGLLTTAKRMFTRNLRAIAAEYAGVEGEAEAELDDLRKILAKAGAQLSRRLRN